MEKYSVTKKLQFYSNREDFKLNGSTDGSKVNSSN